MAAHGGRGGSSAPLAAPRQLGASGEGGAQAKEETAQQAKETTASAVQ